MKNLPKEQIFQLKAMALDAAVKTGQENVVNRAQEIYNFLTEEIKDVPAEGTLQLVKATTIV